MKRYILIFMCLFGWNAIHAQDMPPNVDRGEKNPHKFISSILLEINAAALNSTQRGLELAKEKNMLVKDGRVYVDFEMGNETDTKLDIDNSIFRDMPEVETTTTFVNRTSAWVRAEELFSVASSLPKGYRMNEVVVLQEDNQGPGLINSDSYSGQGGNGVRIGIIDGAFDFLTEARAAGTAPTAANTTAVDYTGTGIETGSNHGTGCLETVFDHAPDARYFIYKVGSVTDVGSAVTHCIANDVDIITMSQSRYNLGWADNTGAACAAAATATLAGMLFFTSCGNRNGEHIQGPFNDTDGDDWHNWAGADEQNNFTVSNNGWVQAYLQWNGSSSTDNYDLFLYDANTNVLIASSTNSGNFETIIYQNTTGSTRNVYLAVNKNTASPPHFELFNHGISVSDFEYFSTSGSSTSPSNSTASNVISVGAVHRTVYDEPAGTTGIIEGYSSRGPTNSGNQAPDICSPTRTTASSYPLGFGGTSCATPNAAGAAAAFWSSHPNLSATGVREILFAKADVYKDWGANGADNAYGHGGVFLHDYSSSNRYIVKNANNSTSLSTLPYRSMGDVDDDAAVPNNRIIYYLDATDVLTAPNVLTKPMLYRSIPSSGTRIE